jgi:hypothetical protein
MQSRVRRPDYRAATLRHHQSGKPKQFARFIFQTGIKKFPQPTLLAYSPHREAHKPTGGINSQPIYQRNLSLRSLHLDLLRSFSSDKGKSLS